MIEKALFGITGGIIIIGVSAAFIIGIWGSWLVLSWAWQALIG